MEIWSKAFCFIERLSSLQKYILVYYMKMNLWDPKVYLFSLASFIHSVLFRASTVI